MESVGLNPEDGPMRGTSPRSDGRVHRHMVGGIESGLQRGSRLDGEFKIGGQSGGIDGRLQDDHTVLFTFDGFDEMDPIHGLGTVTIVGDRLTIALRYHMGDEFSFECVRRS